MSPGRRWRPLIAALGLWALAEVAGAVEPQRPAEPDSAAGRALQAQAVGDDPATAWSWLRAWGQVFPGDHPGYLQLRRGLVDLYLKQAAGEPFPHDATLDAVRLAGMALPPLAQDRDAQARWARALAQGLAPLRASPQTPLPDEIESLADRLQPLAPGLWLMRHPDGRVRNLMWSLRVAVRGTVPLAPQALEARLPGPAGDALVFDCPPARAQPRAVRPGDTWQLLCRSRGEVAERSPALQALAASLTRDGAALPTWFSPELQRQSVLEPMIDALTARVPDRTAAYAQAHAPCALRGRCQVEQAAERRRTHAATGAARPLPPEPEPASTPEARKVARAVAALVAAFMAFCFVARIAGDRVAAGLMLAVLVPLAWWFGRGFGAASVLLVGGAIVAAVLATGGFLVAYWLYDALVFSRFVPRAAARRPGRRASA